MSQSSMIGVVGAAYVADRIGARGLDLDQFKPGASAVTSVSGISSAFARAAETAALCAPGVAVIDSTKLFQVQVPSTTLGAASAVINRINAGLNISTDAVRASVAATSL